MKLTIIDKKCNKSSKGHYTGRFAYVQARETRAVDWAFRDCAPCNALQLKLRTTHSSKTLSKQF